jgi:phage head maturation protease
MNRTDLIGLETDKAQRRITAPFELRQDSTNGSLVYKGHAATTNTPYDVYGGAPFGWTETVARGAFKRTLSNNADVAFLINHDGMTLARTKSGTMTLREDNQGLAVTAQLDPTNSRRAEPLLGRETRRRG